MAYRVYNSVTALKNAVSSLVAGDICETISYYNPVNNTPDGGRAKYLIVSDSGSADDGGYILRVSTTLVAKLVIENNEINALQYGARRNWKQYPNEPAQSSWPIMTTG